MITSSTRDLSITRDVSNFCRLPWNTPLTGKGDDEEIRETESVTNKQTEQDENDFEQNNNASFKTE